MTSASPIVVAGYDGSAAGRAAVKLGIERVRDGGQLVIVHSYPLPPDYLGAPFYQEVLDRSAEHGEELIAELLSTLPELEQIDYEPDLVTGPAAAAICRVAETRGADEIIVGTRGLGRLLSVLGGVAHEVLHRATCPVTVIPRRMLPGNPSPSGETAAVT